MEESAILRVITASSDFGIKVTVPRSHHTPKEADVAHRTFARFNAVHVGGIREKLDNWLGRRSIVHQTFADSAFDVPQETLESVNMARTRVTHVLAQLVGYPHDIRSCPYRDIAC